MVRSILLSALLLAVVPIHGSGLPPRGSDLNDLGSPDDHEYEHGKSIFKGRNLRYGNIKYCVPLAGGGQLVKVKKKTLQHFAKGLRQDLINNLYDCKQPKNNLVNVMQEADMLALVYYLDKRHNLNLN